MSRWLRSRSSRWALLTLLALVVASIALRGFAAAAVEAPQLLCDEFTHAAESRGLWSEGQYAFRGVAAQPHSLLVPVITGPAQITTAAPDAYSTIKAINVLLVSLVAVPMFLLARQLMRPAWALVAAALALAIPGLAFAGLIMTESAFFPAVALAVWLSVRAVERPTWDRQLLALGSIALAAGVRPQGAVLVLALLAAVPLATAFNARAEGRTPGARELFAALGRFRLSIGLLAAVVLLVPVTRVVRGQSPRSALGPYEAVVDGPYTPGALIESVGLHAALLPLSVVLVPVIALAIMTACAWRPSGTRDVAERSFIAVALTSLLATFAVTTSFAAAFTDGRIAERYAFSMAPILMVCFTLWLDRGLPRPRGTTAIAAAVPVALIAGIPFGRYLSKGVPLDTPSAMLPRWTADAMGLGSVGIAVLLIGAGALVVALAVLAPRRVARIALPAIVGAGLVGASVAASDHIQEGSEFHRLQAGPTPTWIDDTLGSNGRATFLDVTEPGEIPAIQRTTVALQAEFWNRSVRGLAHSETPLCRDEQARLLASGEIDVDGGVADHVVTFRETVLAGERLRVLGRLALTRVDPPLRVIARTEEIGPDGWFGDRATIQVLRGREDGVERAVLSLSRPAWARLAPPARVTASLARGGGGGEEPIAVREVRVATSGRSVVALPLPEGPSTITVESTESFTLEELGLPGAPELPNRPLSARLDVELVGA